MVNQISNPFDRFIGVPFFPNKSYWNEPQRYRLELPIGEFSIPCLIEEIDYHEGCVNENGCRESVYINILTTKDNLIISIDAETALTLSERSTDFVPLNRSEIKVINNILQSCTYDRIDFSDAKLLYKYLKIKLPKIAKVYFDLINQLLDKKNLAKKNELKVLWFIIGAYVIRGSIGWGSIKNLKDLLNHLATNFRYVYVATTSSYPHLGFPKKQAELLSRECERLSKEYL